MWKGLVRALILDDSHSGRAMFDPIFGRVEDQWHSELDEPENVDHIYTSQSTFSLVSTRIIRDE